jgi:hypothetical protein
MTELNISLLLLVISNILLFVAGFIGLIISSNKYGYSKWYLLIALVLFISPSLIFVLIPLCEYAEMKKKRVDAFDLMKGKVKIKIAVATFVFYYLLFLIFNLILKYSSANPDWYSEIAFACINVVMLLLIPLYLYSWSKIKVLFKV